MPRLCSLITLSCFLLLVSRSLADEAFFRRQVAPVFEKHCVRCHQGPEPKGGLSLRTRDAALRGGDSGKVIVPGKPAASLLVEHISGDKPAMPKNANPLTAAEVAAIRKWIAAGAAWPEDLTLENKFLAADWWSLKPLARISIPQPSSSWVRTPVDALILAKLREHGLSPSPPAERRTLIRRLTYDLHGLPPRPEDVDNFVADPTPDAYDRLVERLLASPRYGERWGRHWLDVGHYGESHGYDKDKPRPNAWPYRDYVIRSFNEDKPYARFIREQLAGDVLYPDDPDGVVGTGFIAAGPWDFVGHVELREGTVDKQITRLLDRDDMLTTAMSTFVSLTVHCARCHDHKFDPITQTDYYRLQAVFAGVDRADRPYDADPATARLRRELAGRQRDLLARQQKVRAAMAKVSTPEIRDIDRELEQTRSQLAKLPKRVGGSPTNGYHSAIMPGPNHTKWVQVDLGEAVPIEWIRLIPTRPTDFRDTPGFGFPPRYRVDVSDDAKFAGAANLADHTAADVANPGDAAVAIDGKGTKARYVRITATQLWKRTNDYVFALAELQVLSDGKNVALGKTVTALDSIQAGRWRRANLVDGFSSRARLGGDDSKAGRKRRALETRIGKLIEKRHNFVLAGLNAATRKELKLVTTELAEVAQRLRSLPPKQSVYAAAVHQPRPIHLLRRGSVKNPGKLMPPGAVACLPQLNSDFQLGPSAAEGRRRAALADWIADPRNGLTYRSIVNRIWHYHFGRGLVDTPNDFGRMGGRPTHPRLLDWLAGEFLRGGGSIKRLHRLIVTSSVYRQSSAHRPECAKVDSGNRFLWRMNRRRLEAESIRDAVLSVSGKLDPRMGGPSDRQFYFKDDHSPVYDYTRFDVDSPASFRRGVYRFLVRSVPDPFMECLDCADASLLTPKRNLTLTAQQALALLNNPIMVRQAEHFAERLKRERSGLHGQIRRAYELALSRRPTREELKLLEAYAAKHGLANICRLVLNENEFLFVD